MSKLTQAQRDALPRSAFCGPYRTYPVLDQSDVHDAAGLIGQASKAVQPSIKACIKRKARAHGWTLPKSWQAGG